MVHPFPTAYKKLAENAARLIKKLCRQVTHTLAHSLTALVGDWRYSRRRGNMRWQ